MLRNKYSSKKNAPESMKWIFSEDWSKIVKHAPKKSKKK